MSQIRQSSPLLRSHDAHDPSPASQEASAGVKATDAREALLSRCQDALSQVIECSRTSDNKRLSSQIDALITLLSSFRVQCGVQVSATKPHGPTYNGVRNPRWCLQHEMLTGGSLLHLRHPGLGWLTFSLPMAERQKLANALILHARSDVGQSTKSWN